MKDLDGGAFCKLLIVVSVIVVSGFQGAMKTGRHFTHSKKRTRFLEQGNFCEF